MELKQAIATRIEELLQEKNVSVEELAEKTQLPENMLKNILACKYKKVELHRVFIIAYALGMSLQGFFEAPIFDNVT